MFLDARRILARCAELACHSERDDALTRVFLTPKHRAVNALVGEWMTSAGMNVRVDAIGNVVGRYDGMLGVVTAGEGIAVLHARRLRLHKATEVVALALADLLAGR